MSNKPTATITVNEVPKPKKKYKPRGKPFEKGNAYAAKPGDVRNPEGKNGFNHGSGAAIVSQAAHVHLGRKWNEEEANAFGFTQATVADGIVAALTKAAMNGDVQAARELREITEGKTPETIYLSGGKDKDGETLPVATTTTLNIMFVDPPSKKESNGQS